MPSHLGTELGRSFEKDVNASLSGVGYQPFFPPVICPNNGAVPTFSSQAVSGARGVDIDVLAEGIGECWRALRSTSINTYDKTGFTARTGKLHVIVAEIALNIDRLDQKLTTKIPTIGISQPVRMVKVRDWLAHKKGNGKVLAGFFVAGNPDSFDCELKQSKIKDFVEKNGLFINQLEHASEAKTREACAAPAPATDQ